MIWGAEFGQRGRRTGLAGAIAVALLLLGSAPAHARPSAAHPKSRLECERKFAQKGVSWRKCFSTPPGSSCAYPLEIWRSGFTELGGGDKKYFKVTFSEEQGNPLQVYKWTTQKGVAICPHGVEFRLEKYSGYTEGYNRTIKVHSGPHGGSFEYELPSQPPEGFTLVIRGYFVHPRGTRGAF